MNINFRAFFWIMAGIAFVWGIFHSLLSYQDSETLSLINSFMMGAISSAQFIFYGELLHLVKEKITLSEKNKSTRN
ncbi:hypothetical protein [Mechercharimyces sp. CAU 1602]|uniref:hypothetical protein n=1 Tax=Mechercharimyces sp. CAU 1602 TaxID=2973933 RepID=UPI0021634B8E|nr:hypothetical protein [Mechercharimyces sp. CAU 1602]MCS1351651.1 hypothetical protein [Mechercharimyces sp. CAU 1602]